MKITVKILALLYLAIATLGLVAQWAGLTHHSALHMGMLVVGMVFIAWFLWIDWREFRRAHVERRAQAAVAAGQPVTGIREYCSYCGVIAYGEQPFIHADNCPRPKGEEVVCTVCEGIGEVPDSAMGWYHCGACRGKGVRPC